MKQREVLGMFLFFQRGLGKGRSTLNSGAYNPWAGLLDWSQWERRGRQPGPSIVFPPSRSGHKPSCCHSVTLPWQTMLLWRGSQINLFSWLLPEPFWQPYLSLQERDRYQDTLPLSTCTSTSPLHNSQVIFTGFQMEARHRKLRHELSQGYSLGQISEHGNKKVRVFHLGLGFFKPSVGNLGGLQKPFMTHLAKIKGFWICNQKVIQNPAGTSLRWSTQTPCSLGSAHGTCHTNAVKAAQMPQLHPTEIFVLSVQNLCRETEWFNYEEWEPSCCQPSLHGSSKIVYFRS